MEDELEDRLFYQTYVSHARLLSRASLGAWAGAGGGAQPAAHLWRLARAYLLRYEVAVVTVGALALFLYLQLHAKLTSPTRTQGVSPRAREWDTVGREAAAFALQGRRPHMEDRFVVDEDVRGTGVRLYAIFDGHGGESAADFAQDTLIKSLSDKIRRLKDGPPPEPEPQAPPVAPVASVQRKRSVKKTSASTDDTVADRGISDPELLAKAALRPISREVRHSAAQPESTRPVSLSDYISEGVIDYGKLITDEVLAVDRLLVEKAKKTMDVAGTTALIAVLDGDKLTVANVGDSRGVMCDSKGNAIPLSFDHKPQQMREQKRIKEAGGYIAFNGVWRVAGILATSRAMGDYPLKDKKFVIADPDVLSFDLSDHKPLFVILATDGLWDTFSNEEAVAYVKDHLDEQHFGAKSLTAQSYDKGSVDNITVIVIDLRKGSSDKGHGL